MTNLEKSKPYTGLGAPTLHLDGVVATITLNRPEVHNKIEPLDLVTLSGYFEQLNSNKAIKVLIITGSGKSFSSGFDLTQLADATAKSEENLFETLVDRLEALDAITLARLNGPVYGGSTDLALACDFRIATTDCAMFMPAARLGLHYYGHGIRRWVSRIGLGPAKKLFLTARKIQADEMLRIGYLDSVVPAAQLDDEIKRWVDDLSATNPQCLCIG
jgi:enoyl-CoA hydratase